MAYSIDEIIEPFWAEYSSEARGRDPLAIQNSSVTIYSRLIVGITNVTNRIRYNGFYCWVIDAFLKDKRITKKNSFEEQIRYIRRAELLLAYMMVNQFPDETGVSGSDFVRRSLFADINLKTGADWDTKSEGSPRLYWNGRQGAFGQYFIGVLRALDLIHHPQDDLNIYTLTDKGNKLVETYRENINKDEEKLFWKLTFSGALNEDDLSNLKSFSLANIQFESSENLFYRSMMISADSKRIESTYNRRNSIHLMLSYLKTEAEGIENLPLAFLKYNYEKHSSLDELQNHTSTSWYLFEINELLHVALEYFHASFLFSLETFPKPFNEILDKIVEETITSFTYEDIDADQTSVDDLLNILISNKSEPYEHYSEMEKYFRNNELGNCLLNSIKVILSVYNDCKHHLVQLKDYAWAPENNFNRQGYSIELIEDLIQSKLDLSISEYTRTLLLTVINLHTYSSYRKTKIGQSVVHNYMIEDNCVWRLRETLPSRTSPRLQNVVQYLVDLGWIIKKGKIVSISESGNQLLSTL